MTGHPSDTSLEDIAASVWLIRNVAGFLRWGTSPLRGTYNYKGLREKWQNIHMLSRIRPYDSSMQEAQDNKKYRAQLNGPLAVLNS
jgi:hypothetical protein